MPTVRPPATERDEHGVDVGQLVEHLETDGSVPGHDRLVLNRMDEQPLRAGEP